METDLIAQLLGMLESGGDAGSIALLGALVWGIREIRKLLTHLEAMTKHMEEHKHSSSKLVGKASETVQGIEALNTTQGAINRKLDQIGRDVLLHGEGDD